MHDVIYAPIRNDPSHAKSAEYAVQVLDKYLSSKQVKRILPLAMMAADHDAII